MMRAVLLVGALSLAACGSGDRATGDSETAPSTAAPSAAVAGVPTPAAPPGIEMAPPPLPEIASAEAASPYALPARRPGLWRTTFRNQDGQSRSEETCLTPDQARYWTGGLQEARDCPRYQVRAERQTVFTEAVCNTPDGQVTLQGRMTGDFSSAYEGRMVMQIATPQGPVTQQVQTSSEYVGPCGTS